MSEISGKNRARAAPICALAAIKFSSAWRISGRRSSREDGNPAGNSGAERDLFQSLAARNFAGRLAEQQV